MRKKLLALGALVLLVSGSLGAFSMSHKGSGAVHASSGGDWPLFMGDLSRSGANLDETQITPATASMLRYSWKFATTGSVVASPTIVGGVMYIGSWDGNEYAINLSTHQQIWKQFLGITVQSKACYGSTVGVTSTAAVQNAIVYVGGGDGNMYALNAADGSIIWYTMLGNPPYYNFSSPVVYNNLVYTGLAAFCDPPFVQGKVVALDARTGAIVASTSLTAGSQTGATVWSSLAIDPGTNTLFATTGNSGSKPTSQQPLSEAFISLDATTLAVKDHWQIPLAEQILDGDFGATPTLFDLNGIGYIGALNKNDIYYVLNRNNLVAGPVWEQSMATKSTSIQDDNISSSCYNNGVLYVGAGSGTLSGGQKYGGSIQAFNVITGQLLWDFTTPGIMVASVTCLNGLIVDNQGNEVEVRDATSGTPLFGYTTGKRIKGTSVVSNGVLYTPSTDSFIYAFAIPAPTPTPTPTPFGANIFQDNFDSYTPGPLPTGSNVNQWNLVSVAGADFGVNVSNTQAKSAPNSLQFTMGSDINGHAWARKNYGSNFTMHTARFSLYIDPSLTFGSQAIPLFTARNASNGRNGSVSVWLSTSTTLQVIWYDSHGAQHHLGTGIANKLSRGTWYTIELDQTNDPASGAWSLWLNGSRLASQSSIDTGSLPVSAIVVGDTTSSKSTMSGTFYIDDLITNTQHIG